MANSPFSPHDLHVLHNKCVDLLLFGILPVRCRFHHLAFFFCVDMEVDQK